MSVANPTAKIWSTQPVPEEKHSALAKSPNLQLIITILRIGPAITILRNGPAITILRIGPAITILRTGPAITILRIGLAITILRIGPAITILRIGLAITILRIGPAITILRIGPDTIYNYESSYSLKFGDLSSYCHGVMAFLKSHNPTWWSHQCAPCYPYLDWHPFSILMPRSSNYSPGWKGATAFSQNHLTLLNTSSLAFDSVWT